MITWRKSTHSDTGNGCVELANTLDRIRDSKNPHGPTLKANIPALLTHLKADGAK